ncbi:MAG: hypothetical protein SFX18_03045 [Pirellulales bacterium]|nr:hypothetical protein [Pirellulales bacterium]
MPRWRRTFWGFLLTLAAFWLYQALAAPWLEPQAQWHTNASTVSDQQYEAAQKEAERLEPYQYLFPEGSWERQKPILLESAGTMFLLESYENLRDGRIKLSRCSLVFLPDGEVDFINPQKRILILQAPEGAILEFDQPIDLQRAKVGKLIGGVLAGNVIIRGTPSRPGGDDALIAQTSNVSMNEEQMWTEAPVQASLGPHRLAGRGMMLRFLPAPAATGKQRGPRVGGIESFSLATEVRMLLQPGQGGFLPGDRERSTAAAGIQPPSHLAPVEPPLEIRCQGEFLFHMVQRLATFQDQVTVLRLFPNQPADQLTAEWLQVEFQARQKSPAAVAPASATASNGTANPSTALEPRAIHARGRPVAIRAPSSQLNLDAEAIQYDLLTGRVALDGEREVHVVQGQNEYHGRGVTYEPGPTGGLGRLAATGPGVFKAINPDPARGKLEIEFARSLKMRPHERNQVISILGNARVASSTFGELTGAEIHFWLWEQPVNSRAKTTQLPPVGQGGGISAGLLGNAGTVNALPDRLLATGHVNFRTPQITGQTERLEAWFDTVSPVKNRQPSSTPDSSSPPRIVPIQTNAVPPGPVRQTVGYPPDAASPLAGLPHNPPAQPPESRYDVRGELIRVQFTAASGQQALEDITIDNGVRLQEFSTDGQATRGLAIIGDHLEVLRATAPTAEMTVTGKPALVSARGLESQGDIIKLLRGENRVWIDGVGRVKLPPGGGRNILAPGVAGQPVTPANNTPPLPTNAEPIVIDFARGLNFDGQVIAITGDVLVTMKSQRTNASRSLNRPTNLPATSAAVSSPQNQPLITETRTLRTQRVAVKLTERINFQELNSGSALLSREIVPSGGNQSNQPEFPLAEQPAEAATTQVETVTCDQGVVVETREDDAGGNALSWQQLRAESAILNQITGEIQGTGPGELISLRQGRPALPNAAGTRTSPADASTGLQYLHIDYRRGFQGNLLRRFVSFDNQILAVTGPVAGWTEKLDPNYPERLGPQGMVLNCDRLIVAEAPTSTAAGAATVELQAVGNTIVEGAAYTARAYRLTYAQAKDQLVLEGDGRTDAEVNYQAQAGGKLSRAAAARLMFWPGTNRVDISEARMVDLSQLGQ